MTFDEMVASITPPLDQPDLSGTYTKPSGMVLVITMAQPSPRAYRVQGRVNDRLVRAGLYRQDALAPMLRDATKAETKDQA
jgi:hypothetical protein